MKIYRLLLLMLLCVLSEHGFAQTHTFPAQDTTNNFTGSDTFSGTLGIYNHNGIFWAGLPSTPGTPTISAAEASGIATGVCRFDISPTSNSADSANLFTTSMGYKIYAPSSKCFAYDNRQNTSVGTAPMYSEFVMGREAGELTAVGFSLWAGTFGNPIPDSTTASSNFLWEGGSPAVSLPAAGGDQIALAGVVNATDSLNQNGSPSVLTGIDGECNANATGGTGTIAGCWGGSFGAHITRTGATNIYGVAGAIHAFGFGNISSSGGGANAIYVVNVEAPGTALGGGEAFSIYSHGHQIFDQNSSIYAHLSGSGGGNAEHLRFAGTAVLHGVNIAPITANGNVGLGLGALPEGFLWLGNAPNLAYLLAPVNPSANRTINIRDPGATTTLGLSYNGGSSVYQSKRAVAGCTTGASIGGTCASDITVTWGTAFADANYSVSCTGNTPTNVPAAPFIVSGTKLAATVHINYFAITAAAASYASIDCIGVHD